MLSEMSGSRTVRVEDYLNDRLQSQADLDNLDILIQSVQEQQILLRKQASQSYILSEIVTDLA